MGICAHRRREERTMTIPKDGTLTTLRSLLDDTATYAAEYLERLPERRVAPTATAEELRIELGGPLPDGPRQPQLVVAELAKAADPGTMATPGGRFFGFVIGGSLPAALAADWLTSAWDQNAGLYVAAPAASVVEEVCGAWLIELFGLPQQVSYGLVTGCQMANFTALAAARHSVLEAADRDGEADAWVHVDGAFGMWATASPTLRHLVEGIERADSWATDAHKWLNVPYDCGLVFCAHPAAHRAAHRAAMDS